MSYPASGPSAEDVGIHLLSFLSNRGAISKDDDDEDGMTTTDGVVKAVVVVVQKERLERNTKNRFMVLVVFGFCTIPFWLPELFRNGFPSQWIFHQYVEQIVFYLSTWAVCDVFGICLPTSMSTFVTYPPAYRMLC